jgi:hypothetical protein
MCVIRDFKLTVPVNLESRAQQANYMLETVAKSNYMT